MNKICTICQITKNISEYRKNKKYFNTYCRLCENIKNKQYKLKNIDKIKLYNKLYMKQYMKIYSISNKQKLKLYRNNNKEKINSINKKYYLLHKQKIINSNKHYIKIRRSNDLIFKLKENISSNIRSYIRKNNESTNKILPYSILELKNHLEKLFEPWMNWNNWGTYNKAIWIDNDQSTWTWQIDHIVPHSTFNYSSLEDQSFKDCWALNNLRPYSAKQNIIDGARKLKISSLK